MTQDMSAIQPYAEHFAGLQSRLPGEDPVWLKSLRQDAIDRFAEAGFPTPRAETWKYTNLRPLLKQRFTPSAETDAAISIDTVPSVLPRESAGPRLVFINGRLRDDLSDHAALPEGVSLLGLRAALDADPQGIAKLLESETPGSELPLLALNTALMEDGFLLRVARGAVVEKPIEIVFLGGLAEAPLSYHPRNLIVLEESSQATIVEHHLGRGTAPTFANSVSDIRVGQNARLRHLKVQEEGRESFHIATLRATVARDADYQSFGLSIGARLSRSEASVRLEGEGAHCRINGAYLQRGVQHCDNTTVIEHLAPHTGCREVFKGVLDDRARGVFQGKIVVHRDAQQVDGHQLSRALLLSDQAEIDAKPELEIYADDVKCSHGATAGDLDHDALFYLRSRGLPEATARNLLIGSFLAEALQEIEDENLQTQLMARVNDWLPKA
ncbi:MAG: Fe-S cluster assembly protein SufD [Kiloniellales bacterium]|nr:Fe-S cluster assembly protein SufD [Kiloniellales bacterium]